MNYLKLILFFLTFPLFANFPYQISFRGTENQKIIQSLEKQSYLAQQQTLPPSFAALKSRIQEEIPHIRDILNSFGYFSATVSYSIDRDQIPTQIIIECNLGAPYFFEELTFKTTSPQTLYFLPETEPLIEQLATPKKILNLEKKAIQQLQSTGYPFAKLETRDVVADPSSKTVRVIYLLSEGPQVRFGEVKITGNHTVKDFRLLQKIQWKPNELYSQEKVAQTQDALQATQLFTFTTIKLEKDHIKDGRLPITIEVHESKTRSIGAGVSYSNHLGPGWLAEWEHRNMRGRGETLSWELALSNKKQTTFLRYLQPDFLQEGQDLSWKLDLEREILDSHVKREMGLSSTLSRPLIDHLKGSIGFKLQRLLISHSEDNINEYLLSLPLKLQWDATDHPFNPKKGYTWKATCTPTTYLLGRSDNFISSSFATTFYHPLDEAERLIFAHKWTIATINGSSLHDIPPSERLYGGTDSILRGYQYKTVSPLDPKGKPLGGRSLASINLELRMHVSPRWGWTLFSDLGNVYNNSFPQLEKKWLKSLGLGVFYATPIGPIRLDIATPLDRRQNIDDSIQIYFTIGHSF